MHSTPRHYRYNLHITKIIGVPECLASVACDISTINSMLFTLYSISMLFTTDMINYSNTIATLVIDIVTLHYYN